MEGGKVSAAEETHTKSEKIYDFKGENVKRYCNLTEIENDGWFKCAAVKTLHIYGYFVLFLYLWRI